MKFTKFYNETWSPTCPKCISAYFGMFWARFQPKLKQNCKIPVKCEQSLVYIWHRSALLPGSGWNNCCGSEGLVSSAPNDCLSRQSSLIISIVDTDDISRRPRLVRVWHSVPDPDPHVFGPPGSGSGYFYHHAKIVIKILIPTTLWLFLTSYIRKIM
jgi:hypothetical protein